MKVLLVDDEKYALEGLEKMLCWDSFQGVLVGTASNGREALELAGQLNPDVIISDIKMPLQDGLELSVAIAKHFPHINIILLSGHREFEYARKALQYGVKDYILKPITREKIKQLEQLLCTLSAESASRKKYILSIWDPDFKMNILNMLRKLNRQFFDEFFQSDKFRKLLEQDMDNSAGLQMLNFLFLYFSEININESVIRQSKKQAMADYLEITAVTEKMNYIITKYYDVLLSTNQKSNSAANPLVNMALQYADTHYTQCDFNISALANELNISISHLSTIFKQSTGSNLSNYIASLRMNHAAGLLTSGRHPISDIAALSGYEDPKYFAKLFKKKFGCPPSEYRSMIASGQIFSDRFTERPVKS